MCGENLLPALARAVASPDNPSLAIKPHRVPNNLHPLCCPRPSWPRVEVAATAATTVASPTTREDVFPHRPLSSRTIWKVAVVAVAVAATTAAATGPRNSWPLADSTRRARTSGRTRCARDTRTSARCTRPTMSRTRRTSRSTWSTRRITRRRSATAAISIVPCVTSWWIWSWQIPLCWSEWMRRPFMYTRTHMCLAEDKHLDLSMCHHSFTHSLYHNRINSVVTFLAFCLDSWPKKVWHEWPSSFPWFCPFVNVSSFSFMSRSIDRSSFCHHICEKGKKCQLQNTLYTINIIHLYYMYTYIIFM